jgi:PKHD-type hydroxylase
MTSAQHVHTFRLLSPEQLKQIQVLLDTATYVDGAATATDAAKAVKRNLQIDVNDRTVLPHLQQLVGNALMAEPKFHFTFYAANAYPFLFSKCETGMGYGKHVDSPFMGNPPIRTDLAMTVFLDDPSTYDGGELVICDGNNEVSFKPQAGEAVLYPCQYLHYVRDVTRGTRRACVTWFRCSVRNAEQRQILADVKQLHSELAAKDPQGLYTQKLLQTWSNLYRMWGDV